MVKSLFSIDFYFYFLYNAMCDCLQRDSCAQKYKQQVMFTNYFYYF